MLTFLVKLFIVLFISEEYELTVADLKYKDIQRLKGLNSQYNSDTYYWETLCSYLAQHYQLNFKHDDIQLLKHPGSRVIGDTILQILTTSRPDFTVHDFCEVARSLEPKRMDICNCLCTFNGNNNNILLKDLPWNIYFKLTVLCSKLGSVYDWKNIAAELGIEDEQIDEIEQEYQRNCFPKSSTEELFSAIRMNQPTFRVMKLCKCLRELRMIGIADVLQNIIREKSSLTKWQQEEEQSHKVATRGRAVSQSSNKKK